MTGGRLRGTLGGMPLSPCKVCRRHVRAADGRCPFCGSLAAAALAIGMAFFGACGGKTAPTPTPTEIGNGSGTPVDAALAPADAQVPRGDIYGVPEDLSEGEPAPPDVEPAAPIYGVPRP